MFKKIKRIFRRPRDPSGNVYYARLKTPQGTLYKLGYTTKPSLIERMSYGDSGDEKLIDQLLFFTYRGDAWDVEQTLLDHFDKQRAFGKYSKDPSKPLCGRGQSELFANDILGLDDKLYIEADAKEQELKENALDGCLSLFVALILMPFTLGFSLFFFIVWIAYLREDIKLRGSLQTRPEHPPHIQELINSLSCRRNT